MQRQDRACLSSALASVALIALGGIGLVFVDLLRMNFDLALDLFHLVTGAAVIYGIATEKEWLATLLPLGIGTAYLLLGIGGFFSPTLWGIGAAIGLQLELAENLIHLIIGGLGLYAGWAAWTMPRRCQV